MNFDSFTQEQLHGYWSADKINPDVVLSHLRRIDDAFRVYVCVRFRLNPTLGSEDLFLEMPILYGHSGDDRGFVPVNLAQEAANELLAHMQRHLVTANKLWWIGIKEDNHEPTS